MARIQEEYIILKVSKLVKSNEPEQEIVSSEVKETLVQVMDQLIHETVGQHVIVELEEGVN